MTNHDQDRRHRAGLFCGDRTCECDARGGPISRVRPDLLADGDIDLSKDPRGAHMLRRLIADSKALDRIAFRLSTRSPAGEHFASDLRDIVRETGREC